VTSNGVLVNESQTDIVNVATSVLCFTAQADSLCGQLAGVHAVQYLDLDHGAGATTGADSDREPAPFSFPTSDATDYKEIDPLKTKALQVTRCEVESKRRRSSDRLMEV